MENKPVAEILSDVQLRLLSVAAHDEHYKGHKGGDTGLLVELRKNDTNKAIEGLNTVFCQTPVEMRLGTEMVKVFDIESWTPVPSDSIEEVYGSESLAKAAFFACRKTLRPGEILVLDSTKKFSIPGDSTEETLVQNMNSGLGLLVEDLGVALRDGARLALPNQR